MKKLSTSLIFTLIAVFASSAHAWPEVDHMNMCGAAAKVIRDYKGNAKAWSNRDMYTESRKAALYFQANCPNTKAGKIEKAVAKRVAAQAHVQSNTHGQPQAKPRPASCKDCFNAGYKKGLKDGKSSVGHHNTAASSVMATPSHQKPQMIQHGNHQHHNAVQKADCELTDALNRRAGPVVTVIKKH